VVNPYFSGMSERAAPVTPCTIELEVPDLRMLHIDDHPAVDGPESWSGSAKKNLDASSRA